MQQYIKNITSDLVDRLSTEQLYYSPSDLLEAGFPSFLVQRIQLELQKNLAESVKLPESDWADMKADPVQDAWDNFLLAIRAETRIPSSFLKSVTENAVEDVLELLSQPRKAVLETLFRSNEVCQLEELQARRKWIVINSILADALIRYLLRKGLSEISKEQAHYIIKETDKLVCTGFSPLKWAQHLEPWYDLMGKQIPSEPMMLFYLDKEMRSVARQFEEGPDSLTRNQLIEILSTTDFDFADSDLNEIVEDKKDSEKVAAELPDVSHEKDEEAENGVMNSQETTTDEELPFELDETEDELANMPLDLTTVEPVDENLPADDALHELPFDLVEAKVESADLPFDLTTVEPVDEKLPADDTLHELPFDLDETETMDEGNSSGLHAPADEKTEDVPIWQRFVPVGEEIEEPLESESEKLEETEDNVLTIADSLAIDEPHDDDESDEIADDAPGSNLFDTYATASSVEQDSETHETFSSISDLNHSESDPVPDDTEESDEEDVIYLSDDAKALLTHLMDYKDDYVDEIFRGDERAFYVQIGEISTYNNWLMAGKYITRDIFDKNRVDLYSDNAVLFTDAVQEYFEKKEN